MKNQRYNSNTTSQGTKNSKNKSPEKPINNFSCRNDWHVSRLHLESVQAGIPPRSFHKQNNTAMLLQMASLAISERHSRWAKRKYFILMQISTQNWKNTNKVPLWLRKVYSPPLGAHYHMARKISERSLTDYTKSEQINTLISTKASRCFSGKKFRNFTLWPSAALPPD